MNDRTNFPNPCGRQKGTVLFVSLVVMLVLCVFALATANTSIMESKMVGSARNVQLAQFAADSALNDAKARIAQIAAAHGPAHVCVELHCAVRDGAAPIAAAEFMQSSTAKVAAIPFRIDLSGLKGADETAHVASSPVYVIEDLGAQASAAASPSAAPATHAFRITAQGVGGTASYSKSTETVFSVKE
jgi:Tfp pilus assembly protein PilX